ncbi:MAG: hypothetical protein RLZZ549_1388 [Pseudomonadota bacterium]
MQHSPGHLFITFTFIGLSGFGGVLPWARRTLVEQKKWLSAQEFNALLGVCQLVPGPNIVNLAVCVGQRFGGLCGAIAAVAGLMLAPLLYDHYGQFEQVQGMLRGISAVGVGLIAATGFKMLKEELSYLPMLIVIAISIVMATVFHLALGWVVTITLPLAMLFAWNKAK